MWLPECSGGRESFEDLSFLEGPEESAILRFFSLDGVMEAQVKRRKESSAQLKLLSTSRESFIS